LIKRNFLRLKVKVPRLNPQDQMTGIHFLTIFQQISPMIERRKKIRTERVAGDKKKKHKENLMNKPLV